MWARSIVNTCRPQYFNEIPVKHMPGRYTHFYINICLGNIAKFRNDFSWISYIRLFHNYDSLQ